MGVATAMNKCMAALQAVAVSGGVLGPVEAQRLLVEGVCNNVSEMFPDDFDRVATCMDLAAEHQHIDALGVGFPIVAELAKHILIVCVAWRAVEDLVPHHVMPWRPSCPATVWLCG